MPILLALAGLTIWLVVFRVLVNLQVSGERYS